MWVSMACELSNWRFWGMVSKSVISRRWTTRNRCLPCRQPATTRLFARVWKNSLRNTASKAAKWWWEFRGVTAKRDSWLFRRLISKRFHKLWNSKLSSKFLSIWMTWSGTTRRSEWRTRRTLSQGYSLSSTMLWTAFWLTSNRQIYWLTRYRCPRWLCTTQWYTTE